MSISMRAAGWALRLLRTVNKIEQPTASMRRRALARAYPEPAPVPGSLVARCDIHDRLMDGNRVVTLVPKRGATGRHVIYVHGGAYTSPLVRSHWSLIGQLIRRAGVSVTVPLYRLAPEGDFVTGYAFLTTVYQQLLQTVSSNKIILAGDSAGGALALGQAVMFRDAGIPAPAQLVLISPWVDATLENPSIAAIAPTDPMLDAARLAESGRWWAGSSDPRHPLVSPLFADLHDLPPVDIYIGTRDLLLPDARMLDSRIRVAGSTSRLHEYRGAWHVFVAFPGTPEAKAALADIESRLRHPSPGPRAADVRRG